MNYLNVLTPFLGFLLENGLDLQVIKRMKSSTTNPQDEKDYTFHFQLLCSPVAAGSKVHNKQHVILYGRQETS